MNSSSKLIRAFAALTLALACVSVNGCYLLQSARGQLALMAKRQPIPRILERASTPASLRAQLRAVRDIRDFASRDLGLPDNGSYRSYADLGRPYVVWNVVAAPEFSVDPKQWCFPIVGCVAYRGYFHEGDARRFAQGLERDGFEVTVNGIAAYSTLGHFDDPVLNTMLGWSDVELAGIIFHELTHQWLYVSDDAPFNEALATVVEEEGIRRWLASLGRAADLTLHQRAEGRYRQVIELITARRAALKQLYASGLPAVEMRARKQAMLAALRDSYASLERQWGGQAPMSGWFAGPIDNARLASVATYYDCVPGFERELNAANGDLHEFYRRVKALAALAQAERDAAVCGLRASEN